jgi:hypothetical protein
MMRHVVSECYNRSNWSPMRAVEIQESSPAGLSPDRILAQVELMTRGRCLPSKRSIAFLKYVATEAANGAAHQIKERTIGIEVFGRSSSCDTSLDHIVRTAATELRKRLAIYYGDERHRSELRIGLNPGSCVPRFTQPQLAGAGNREVEAVTDHRDAISASFVYTEPGMLHDAHGAIRYIANTVNFDWVRYQALGTNPWQVLGLDDWVGLPWPIFDRLDTPTTCKGPIFWFAAISNRF